MPLQHPTVVLLGRTNVGKTTLFSRITGERGLISPQLHTTRDTKESDVVWDERTFSIIDTGGFDVSASDPFRGHIVDQIGKRVAKASCVIMVIDGADALTKHEENWIRELRTQRVPMIIAVNKQDSAGRRRILQEKTYRGIPMIAVSAVNGGGVGDLLSAVVARLTPRKSASKQPVFSLGIVGRTNVGKSAIFNAILNDDRAIVSPMHHTTRESMKVVVEYEHVPVAIIDTAGAQKHSRNAMFEASQKLTLHTIKTSDVLALVVQAGEVPVPSQDIKLAHTILEERKSLIIVNNKWDTIDDRSPQTRRLEETRIRKAFRGLDFVPIVMTSATTRHRIMDVLSQAGNVYRERFIELQSQDLLAISRSCKKHIRSIIQTGVNPPTFSAVYHQSSVPEAIAPIVIKAIRDRYQFAGTPIIIAVNKSPRNYANASRHRAR